MHVLLCHGDGARQSWAGGGPGEYLSTEVLCLIVESANRRRFGVDALTYSVHIFQRAALGLPACKSNAHCWPLPYCLRCLQNLPFQVEKRFSDTVADLLAQLSACAPLQLTARNLTYHVK